MINWVACYTGSTQARLRTHLDLVVSSILYVWVLSTLHTMSSTTCMICTRVKCGTPLLNVIQYHRCILRNVAPHQFPMMNPMKLSSSHLLRSRFGNMRRVSLSNLFAPPSRLGFGSFFGFNAFPKKSYGVISVEKSLQRHLCPL